MPAASASPRPQQNTATNNDVSTISGSQTTTTLPATASATDSTISSIASAKADALGVGSNAAYSTKLTAGAAVGGAGLAAAGELTINGVTKPVTLTVTSFKTMAHPMLKVPTVGANASTTILRSDFNAGKFAPGVSDEVELDIALEAIAK